MEYHLVEYEKPTYFQLSIAYVDKLYPLWFAVWFEQSGSRVGKWLQTALSNDFVALLQVELKLILIKYVNIWDCRVLEINTIQLD